MSYMSELNQKLIELAEVLKDEAILRQDSDAAILRQIEFLADEIAGLNRAIVKLWSHIYEVTGP